MAFPSTTGTKQDNLSDAWERARSLAGQIKSQTQSLRNDSAAGAIDAFRLVDLATMLAGAKVLFLRASGLAGIVNYARSQIDDPTFDVVANFTAMIAQVDNLISVITTNFPKDGSGFLLERSFAADGTWISRKLTTAQTALFRTAADSLIASID